MESILLAACTALISSVIGAVVGAVVSKVKTVKKASDDARHESAELKELMRQNIIMTCRMAIYDDHFSVDEKLDAYQIYRDHGGNHQTKKYMDGQVGCDVDEYLERHR
ncbi:MAG: hypothetical protein IIZ12_00325 [Eggerthellaceae bacterium]|nr:hypothetical protein [Eggerthellaceae bacterium]